MMTLFRQIHDEKMMKNNERRITNISKNRGNINKKSKFGKKSLEKINVFHYKILLMNVFKNIRKIMVFISIFTA